MTNKTAQDGSALQAPAGFTLAEKVLEHINVSDKALQKAAASEADHVEKQAAITALIPQVVETLVKFERINPNQAEKMAEMLTDPKTVLELMIKVSGHRSNEENARLGSGVDASMNKTASAGISYNPASSLTDPNVGQLTTRVKQSSVNLFQGLGLAAPTGA